MIQNIRILRVCYDIIFSYSYSPNNVMLVYSTGDYSLSAYRENPYSIPGQFV